MNMTDLKREMHFPYSSNFPHAKKSKSLYDVNTIIAHMHEEGGNLSYKKVSKSLLKKAPAERVIM